MLEPKCFNKFTKFCQILMLTLLLVALPCFLAKVAQILQIKNMFFLKTYLDSPMAEVFPHYCLSFSVLAIFREKLVVKVGLKVQTLDPFFFMKTRILQIFFKQCFLFPRVLPLVRISAILDRIWGSKGPKSSHKRPFHGCWIVTQNFENF